MSRLFAMVLFCFSISLAASSFAEDWPHWRGPDNANVASVKSLAQDWSGGFRQIWKVEDLCDNEHNTAWSQPSIAGDRLVITGRRGAKDMVFCLNPDDGKAIWSAEYEAPGKLPYGAGPRATAWIESDSVYTFGALGHLASWNLADGKQNWMVNVEKLGGKRPVWGHSSSPLVHGDNVIVQAGGKAIAIAVNRKTGDVAWQAEAGAGGYAAITRIKNGAQEQLLVFAGDGLVALEPGTGKTLWKAPWKTAFNMNCTTPLLVGGNKVLLGSSTHENQGGGGLLELTATGAKELWRHREVGNAHNDPVVIDGHAYMYSGFSLDQKEFVCVELATGKVKWRTNELGGPGTAIQVGKQMMCLSNRGNLALVDPSPEGLKKVTEFAAINGNPVWVSPVILRGRIYLRHASQLICYELPGTERVVPQPR